MKIFLSHLEGFAQPLSLRWVWMQLLVGEKRQVLDHKVLKI